MGFELFNALAEEWRVLAGSPEGRRAVRRWGDDDALAGMRSLDEVLERTGPGTDLSSANSVLFALARRAGHDEVAARALLQALCPGLRRVARRMGAARDSDVSADAITTAWVRIRTYPCERRPDRVAANVIQDVFHTLWKERSRTEREVPVDPQELRDLPEPDEPESARPDVRHVLEVVASSGRVPDAQVQLIADAVLDRVPSTDAAARAGISLKAMRARRERARRRVMNVYREVWWGSTRPPALGIRGGDAVMAERWSA